MAGYKAHRFQEKYTGVQIYVWHARDESEARRKFNRTVVDPDSWVYLGTTNNGI